MINRPEINNNIPVHNTGTDSYCVFFIKSRIRTFLGSTAVTIQLKSSCCMATVYEGMYHSTSAKHCTTKFSCTDNNFNFKKT